MLHLISSYDVGAFLANCEVFDNVVNRGLESFVYLNSQSNGKTLQKTKEISMLIMTRNQTPSRFWFDL